MSLVWQPGNESVFSCSTDAPTAERFDFSECRKIELCSAFADEETREKTSVYATVYLDLFDVD